MNLDWMARPGGQLLGCYFLIIVALIFSTIDHSTGTTLLNILIGAIVRDMQDSRAASGAIPNGQKESQIK